MRVTQLIAIIRYELILQRRQRLLTGVILSAMALPLVMVVLFGQGNIEEIQRTWITSGGSLVSPASPRRRSVYDPVSRGLSRSFVTNRPSFSGARETITPSRSSHAARAWRAITDRRTPPPATMRSGPDHSDTVSTARRA